MLQASETQQHSNKKLNKAQDLRLGGLAPFAFSPSGFDPFLPVLLPCSINSNSCDKSTIPSQEVLREEFAGAALDDAIRADYKVLHPACGAQVSLQGCADGHLYGISAICGREWCDKCGGHRGRAHNRRVGQFLAMTQEWASVAYAVLTIPLELRGPFRDLRLLSKAGASLRRWLREHGVKRGVTRWHLYGEAESSGVCEESPLSGPGFAPHLNILCEAGYLSPDLLAALRRTWRLVLERLAGAVMDSRGHEDRTDALVIEWQYTVPAKGSAGVGKALHWLTYMMGPRFLDSQWDLSLALSVVGWRNSVRWGKMSGVIAWELADLELADEKGGEDVKRQGGMSEAGRCVLSGECPECGGRLKSLGVVPRDKLVVMEDYGGGVFKLAMLKSDHNKPKMEEKKRGAR